MSYKLRNIIFGSGLSLTILLSVQNAIAVDSISLRSQAMQETLIPAQDARISATEAAQAAGMLKLRDPRPEALNRSWKYFLRMSVERFQPQGSAQNSTGSTFNLDSAGASSMPGLAMGITQPLMKLQSSDIGWGAGGALKYSLQNQSVQLQSGYTIQDAKLSTILLTGNVFASVTPTFAKSVEFQVGPEWGDLNYTQVSSNDFANFSKHAQIFGLLATARWSLSQDWAVFLQQHNLKVQNSDATIAVAAQQYELGAQIQW